jgi:RNAse (barnase) inhibitor barstar
MIVGALPVHFATGESAAGLRTEAGDSLREIRGWTGEEDLFRAIASALQFPDYFGYNWDAFDECLREVDSDVVLLVHDAANMWREAPAVATTLVDAWLTAAEECEARIHLVFVW